MDGQLRALERRVLSAPDDAVVRGELRATLFRLAPLDDRERWAAASPSSQDLVLTTIGRLLGSDYEPLGAAVYAAGGARHRIGAWRHAPTRVVLHLVPGGSFRMGSDDVAAERPPRLVAVEPLLIGRYPVRQLEWDRAPQPDERSWTGPELPIEGVTWSAARAWLAAVGLRLPSEAEWEWACRAGTTSHYFWGDAMDDAYCWHDLGDAWTSHPPAAHDDRPNAFGLVDPSGNVAEWVEDVLGPYASAPTDGSAARQGGALRVLRGGDGFGRASHCRSASRGAAAAKDLGAGIGFRAARSLPT
jgi:formylglycine-generating enzyme required for sulfatase activity